MEENYNKKYLKYKEKYLALKKELSHKNMKGGMFPNGASGDSGALGSFNNLDKLPFDVIYESVLPSLPIKDVVNLGMTNRRLYEICTVKCQS
jgi:hypothetical protein